MEKKMKDKCSLETYEPERKIRVSKEEAIPWLIKAHENTPHVGAIGLFLSGVLAGVSSFFHLKKKVKEINPIKHRYLVLKNKRFKN